MRLLFLLVGTRIDVKGKKPKWKLPVKCQNMRCCNCSGMAKNIDRRSINIDRRHEDGEVYRFLRLKTCFTGYWFDKSNRHEETTLSKSESSEIITWRFRGSDWWIFSPLSQGALLNENWMCILRCFKCWNQWEKPYFSPKEASSFSCCSNDSR